MAMAGSESMKSRLLTFQALEANKLCAECGTPSPQWASLNFASLICLKCSGAHRSYGVHISFVRSVQMDKWTEPQVLRMELGGNEKLIAALGPGSSDQALMKARYHSAEATQYRENLDKESAAKGGWVPAAIPTTPYVPSSNVALESNSTISGSRDNGRYGGFGSQPQSDAFNSTDNSAPGLSEITEDPMKALSKGWGFLSSAVSSATKTINASFVQPTVARAQDPETAAYLKSATSNAFKTASSTLSAGSEAIKRETGVDLNAWGDKLGRAVAPAAKSNTPAESDDFFDKMGAGDFHPSGSSGAGVGPAQTEGFTVPLPGGGTQWAAASTPVSSKTQPRPSAN